MRRKLKEFPAVSGEWLAIEYRDHQECHPSLFPKSTGQTQIPVAWQVQHDRLSYSNRRKMSSTSIFIQDKPALRHHSLLTLSKMKIMDNIIRTYHMIK
jgi:hypothetical protein